MELNKEQIIKALECCTRGRKSKKDIPCLDCPYNECNMVGGTSERQIKGTCQGWLMKDALALIKELTEENERLRADKDYWKIRAKESESEYDQAVKKGYNLGAVDYVRSFAERLKAKAKDNEWNGTICGEDIDQIAKEMLEGNNENND